ncbi:MAG: hypothetical protein KKB02_12580 [Alphaproteobacteria bacterium]|nr:hypothetical protein [Alphaproteobacteria bacterium]
MPRRETRHGIVLITTLVGLILLSGMVVTLQVRTLASVKVLARLDSRHVDAMAETAIRARLAARLDSARPPPLNGTVTQDVFAGRTYRVRLTDVEGLVDLYLAPPEVLGLLPFPAEQVVQMREVALASLTAGERFLTVNQTLVRFGFDRASRLTLAPLVTQSARTGQINPAMAPESIQAKSRLLDAQDVASGLTAEVAVWRILQP